MLSNIINADFKKFSVMQFAFSVTSSEGEKAQ